MARHKQTTNGPQTATVEAGQMPPVPTTDADGQSVPGAADGLAPHEGEPNAGAAVSKPKESKRSRFIRLASRRVSKALKALRAVANLGNRNVYDYAPEHVDKVIDVLTREMMRVEDAFKDSKVKDDGFTL